MNKYYFVSFITNGISDGCAIFGNTFYACDGVINIEKLKSYIGALRPFADKISIINFFEVDKDTYLENFIQ